MILLITHYSLIVNSSHNVISIGCVDQIHPGKTRRLLKDGKASLYRRYPLALILDNCVPKVVPKALPLKIDLIYPNGSKQIDSHVKHLTAVPKADGYAFVFAAFFAGSLPSCLSM